MKWEKRGMRVKREHKPSVDVQEMGPGVETGVPVMNSLLKNNTATVSTITGNPFVDSVCAFNASPSPEPRDCLALKGHGLLSCVV
jgi:hypothetical protein